MISVAIDGPSGAGKSSISKTVAKKLGFIHVDTGALYRALAYTFIKNCINLGDEISIENLLKMTNVKIKHINGVQSVFVNDENITGFIRTEEVSMGASNISKMPIIRSFLLGLQRQIAAENNVIMDGRDIGTVVLPNADVKIFLTASAEKRAERRYRELLAKNEKVEYNKVLEDVIKRDKQDIERETAPLRPSEDAVIVDTSTLDFGESVSTIIKIVKERM